MQIRLRDSGAVVTENEFRAQHPNTSFPAQLSPELLDSFDADPVLNAPQPTPGEFEIVVQDGVVQDSLGNWVQNWVAHSMFTEYTDEEGTVHTVEEQQAAYTAQRLEQNRQGMVVSKFQGKAALLQAGLLSDVEALVADPLTDPLVVLAWQDVTEFRRLSPMVAGIAAALGWSDEQLDELFDAAALITA